MCKLIVILLFLSTCFASSSFGQDSTRCRTNSFSISPGFGLSNYGIVYNADFTLIHKKNLFEIGFMRNTEFLINFTFPDTPDSLIPKNERTDEYRFLYGYSNWGTFGIWNVCIGPSFLKNFERNKVALPNFDYRYEYRNTYNLGLSLQTEFIVIADEFIAVGVKFFGNVNPHKIYGGGTLSLYLGNFRKFNGRFVKQN
jgi:hypothetical protein